MPPPLPSQQGSRAGLITTLVIFIVFFLVSTIFWISDHNKLTLAEQQREDVIKKYKPVISDQAMTSSEVNDAAKKSPGSIPTPAFDALVQQREDLIKVITGTGGVSAGDAALQGTGAINEANNRLKAAGVSGGPGATAAPPSADATAATSQPAGGAAGPYLTPGQSLTSAIVSLAQSYIDLNAQRQQVVDALAAATTDRAAAEAQHKTEVEGLRTELGKKDQETAAAKAGVDAVRQQNQQDLAKLTADTSVQIKALSDAIAAGQTVLAQKEADIKGKANKIANLENVLRNFRLDARENQIRQPDGYITRIPGDGYCYINLGVGDHVTAGMTFEVYDKIKGVPPLGNGLATADDTRGPARTAAAAPAAGGAAGGAAGATGLAAVRPAGSGNTGYSVDMPVGKASIEIVSVGPGKTSQGRFIKIEPGQVPTEGDIIANLVYDPKVKPKFFVYGDFDLDHNGIPSAQDAAVIRRLVEQWGGTLQPDVVVESDFVVMGLEPKVPNFTPEELAIPSNADAQQKAQAQLQAYRDVVDKASRFGVPLLNQDRFLYYVGYYDQKRR